jgi:RND family efflux transporter MFP subunit
MENNVAEPKPGAKTHFSKRIYLPLSITGVAALVMWLALRPSASKAKAEVEGPPAVPVPVAKVQREDLFKTLKVQAEFRPYTEVQLHAKVSGYLQQIGVDFGDRVKAGQVLATLEVPELQDELNNALATEQKANADYKNAHLAYTRLLTAIAGHSNLIAQQELDSAEARNSTALAAVAAAKAEREKYQTLAAYTKITAPFDGVITHRYADPGALIQSGTASATQTMPIVRLSDNYRLRLDFPISVDYVKDIQAGEPVEVHVDSLGGKTFTGKISRFTERVEETTRTMITEMDVDNPKLELVPGMYATVVLRLEERPRALAIPTEAIAAGRTTVSMVNANHEIEERAVKLGLETPTKYEVLSGVSEGDLVIIGSAPRAKSGQKVEPKLVSLLTAR